MKTNIQESTKHLARLLICALIGLSSLLLITSCGTLNNNQNDDLRKTLASTWIHVEDDMIRANTASQFFPKLNKLIRDAKPNRRIEIFVASDLLPQMVTVRALDHLDPFADPQSGTRREGVPIISSGRLMTLFDLLKLLCDVTRTQLIFEKGKVLIVPEEDRQYLSAESNWGGLGTN